MIFYNLIGMSPQMKLIKTENRIILQSKIKSKLFVFLILIWIPAVLLAINAPAVYISISLVVAVIGGATYSKCYIFDGAVKTLSTNIVKFGIKQVHVDNFKDINKVKAVSSSWRRGIDLTVVLKSDKKLVIDTTEDERYIEKAITLINGLLHGQVKSH